jgi:anti-sigma-K factor RskA
MSTDAPDENNPLTRAAEYVLGLLEPRAVSAFEAEMSNDPDLRDEVVFWTEYFVQFAEGTPEVAPRKEVQVTIDRRLFGNKPSIWRRVIPFFSGGLAAAALTWGAVSFGVLDQFAAPQLRADLVPVEGTLELAAIYDGRTSELHVIRYTGGVPTNRVAEMWLIVGQNAPVSLGLLNPDGDTRVAVPAAMASLLPGATLAISDEPPGGSSTGAPSGTVRAAGILALAS